MTICKAGVELELNRTYYNTPVIINPKCRFTYKCDLNKSSGQAQLTAIDNLPISIVLHPTGTEGMWDFVSDIQPTQYLIDGKLVVIYRVALNIDPFTGEQSAAILLNERGSCIVSTGNFDTYCTALTA